jgi:uridylate kinase
MRDTDIPIVVFSLHERGGLQKVLRGQGVQTVISTHDETVDTHG